MLVEVYILFWILGTFFGVLGFIFQSSRGEYLLLPWVATIFFFVIGITSFSIDNVYCGRQSVNATASEWGCYKYMTSDTGLAYTGLGLGSVFLMYAIYSTIQAAGKGLTEGIKS